MDEPIQMKNRMTKTIIYSISVAAIVYLFCLIQIQHGPDENKRRNSHVNCSKTKVSKMEFIATKDFNHGDRFLVTMDDGTQRVEHVQKVESGKVKVGKNICS